MREVGIRDLKFSFRGSLAVCSDFNAFPRPCIPARLRSSASRYTPGQIQCFTVITVPNQLPMKRN